MSVTRFENMVDAILALPDSNDGIRELKLLRKGYNSNADFNTAFANKKVVILQFLADIINPDNLAYIIQNVPSITDQDIWDAFIASKSGEERVQAAFRLLRFYNKQKWYGKVADLAIDMLSRIDNVTDDFKRIRYMLQLGESLEKPAHLAAFVATASWLTLRADINAYPDTDLITEWYERADIIERRSAAPPTVAELDTQAGLESDPIIKLYLLKQAQELEESQP